MHIRQYVPSGSRSATYLSRSGFVRSAVEIQARLSQLTTSRPGGTWTTIQRVRRQHAHSTGRRDGFCGACDGKARRGVPLSSPRRDSAPATSRVREKTSNGRAKSRTSTSLKRRMPTKYQRLPGRMPRLFSLLF